MSRGRSLKIAGTIGGAILSIALVAFLIRRGYEVGWTGFGAHIGDDGKTVPPKYLWDWLSLLIVPLLLAFAAWVLNNSRKAADAKTENDRQRQKSLDDYFEWITDLILEGHLDSEQKGHEARSLARTKTLTVLRVLDGDRKAQVLQFLYEAQMLRSPPTISLVGADFRGAVLDEATLMNAEIRGSYFAGATFRAANLRGADMRGCDFTKADFSGANLMGGNFKQAILSGATLLATNLTDVNLDDADLSRARLAPNARRKRGETYA